MSSARKFAQGDKKNLSKEEKFALGELVEKYKKENFGKLENPPPPAINISEISQPPLPPELFQPPPHLPRTY